MSENLIRLSQIINCMESAGKVNNPDSRHRILAQYREEASWHLRMLEEQEVERECHVSPTVDPNHNSAHHAG